MVDSNNRPRLTKEAKRLSQDMSRIGMVLSGRYELTELLGRGGMGAVYKARHIQMDRFVAVKMLLPDLIDDDPSMHDRFLREAKASGKISHPNVVQLLDFGEGPGGEAYIVIEYLKGISLDQLIVKEGYLPYERAAAIFEQICEGVGKAHAKGIIHRDLKPSNVMLVEEEGRSDFVKIVDFGLAKALDPAAETQKLTRTGEIFGSPVYMSPEQCMGDQLDARSDIYAMGILMYECLTGKVPFIGANLAETVAKHLQEAPKKFSAVLGDHEIPRALESAVLKSLSKDRYERQSSMKELRDEIVEALGTAPDPQRKPIGLQAAVQAVAAPSQEAASVRQQCTAKTASRPEPDPVEPGMPPPMVPGSFVAIVIGICAVAVLAAGVFIGVSLSRPKTSDQSTSESKPQTSAPAKKPETKAVAGAVAKSSKKNALLPEQQPNRQESLSATAALKQAKAKESELSAKALSRNTRKLKKENRTVHSGTGNKTQKADPQSPDSAEGSADSSTYASRRRREHDWHDYSYGIEKKESYSHSWSVPVAGSKSE